MVYWVLVHICYTNSSSKAIVEKLCMCWFVLKMTPLGGLETTLYPKNIGGRSHWLITPKKKPNNMPIEICIYLSPFLFFQWKTNLIPKYYISKNTPKITILCPITHTIIMINEKKIKHCVRKIWWVESIAIA